MVKLLGEMTSIDNMKSFFCFFLKQTKIFLELAGQLDDSMEFTNVHMKVMTISKLVMKFFPSKICNYIWDDDIFLDAVCTPWIVQNFWIRIKPTPEFSQQISPFLDNLSPIYHEAMGEIHDNSNIFLKNAEEEAPAACEQEPMGSSNVMVEDDIVEKNLSVTILGS
jgi:hypothetical protein